MTMDMRMTMDMLKQMASNFWLENGYAPTHLLVSIEQQKDFSLTFAPKERIEGQINNAVEPVIGAVKLGASCMVDLLPINTRALGNTHSLKLPKMIRLEE